MNTIEMSEEINMTQLEKKVLYTAIEHTSGGRDGGASASSEQLLGLPNCRNATKQPDPNRKIEARDWALLGTDMDAFINHTAVTRGVSVESLAPYRNALVGGIVQCMDEAARNACARNQVYVALGNLLTTAALLGIDACPMEGFDRTQYDEILKGFATAVIAAPGYRSVDTYANGRKVRFAKGTVNAL
jgi:nitroreductase